MAYVYKYPRPALTVDAVVFCREHIDLYVLLIERARPPFQGTWALPGGFVDIDESLEDAVARELKEETGVEGIDLKQFYTFGTPGRDPRHRTVSVAYYGERDCMKGLHAGDDAGKAAWFHINDLPPLAFDHKDIVLMAYNRYRKDKDDSSR